jgi:ubiquinone/menaquinone biosynthesis C-methylase UbiE
MMSGELVKRYYTELAEGEWDRLERNPYHRLEFDTTMYFLRKHMPARGVVLDAGGGPGRYTVELAKLGHDVVLLDLTPKMLEIARGRIEEAGVGDRVKQVLEGSAEDLSVFETGSFDAVLCLGGPLSHLVHGERRLNAVKELIRVAGPGAPIFASVISRLAMCMNSIVYLWPEMKDNLDLYRQYTTTGQYLGGYGFAPCHFYTPEELRGEFEGRAQIIEMVGLEGMFSSHEERYNEVHALGEYNELLWETHLRTCTHPSIVGVSEHFMIVCRKKGTPVQGVGETDDAQGFT